MQPVKALTYPRHEARSFLIGWYKQGEAKGNYRVAASMADDWMRENYNKPTERNSD